MRERTKALLLGAEGTGKSHLAKYLFGLAMQRKESVKILDPNGGLAPYPMPADPDAYVADLIAKGWRGMLVADDCENYIPKVLPKDSPWRTISFQGRHLGIDVLYTAHRVADLPVQVQNSIKHLYLFALNTADQANIKALSVIAPGIQPPQVPYEFIQCRPGSFDLVQSAKRWRTKRGGGIEVIGGS